jgi:hypothetical protein
LNTSKELINKTMNRVIKTINSPVEDDWAISPGFFK